MSAPRTSLPAQGNFFSRAFPFILCLALLIAILGASIAVGTVPIPFGQLVGILAKIPSTGITPDPLSTIVWELRLPRTLFMALAGMSLACSGCAYQGIFRNSLADPYLLGIGSGAGLGAVVAITFPGIAPGLPAIPLFAFIGALLTVILVYQWARPERGAASSTRLILSGVAAGSFANALTTFLLFHSRGEMLRAMNWLMGGFMTGGWAPVWISLPYLALGILVLTAMGRVLNLLQFGEEQAEQTGLNVARARWILIAAASLTTAAGVAFGGVIGFIGLAVPHLARLLWGSDYRRLLPLSALLGASVLLAADILARVAFAPQELPVGIVTALFGAPFFFFLLRRSIVGQSA